MNHQYPASTWAPWFAWHPVYIADHGCTPAHWAWFRYVERRAVHEVKALPVISHHVFLEYREAPCA